MGRPLVILAAGVGRRFGGLKQLTAVGAHGEAIMDYTVFDALRSGFDEVILVIRRETEEAVLTHVDAGFGKHVSVRYVHQELGDEAQAMGRTWPWGTTQAVLAASGILQGSFAVANADDYYGQAALAALGDFLAMPTTTPPTWAMVGFAVADTLPNEGMVSRGLVHAENGFLQNIEEVHTVRRHPDGAVWAAPEGPRVIPASTLVSMNLWGFGREVLGDLDQRFRDFLDAGPGPTDECYLPTCVGAAVADGTARVTVLPADSRWCGMTSAADLPVVKGVMADLVAEGVYPARLWG